MCPLNAFLCTCFFSWQCVLRCGSNFTYLPVSIGLCSQLRAVDLLGSLQSELSRGFLFFNKIFVVTWQIVTERFCGLRDVPQIDNRSLFSGWVYVLPIRSLGDESGSSMLH